MTKQLCYIDNTDISNIASAIREKTGETKSYLMSEMPSAIRGITTGSTSPNYEKPTITVSASGLITATANGMSSTSQLTVQAAKTVTPSESEQTAVNARVYTTGSIKVGAIPSTYVGTGVSKQAAKTVTPTTTSQTAVASGVYTTGAVTVGAIPSQYIIPSGSQTLSENKTYDVTSLASVTVSVPTSSGMNVQAYQGYSSVSATTYTATNVKLTVAKTGTYNVSWMGWRNTTSGTNGSQLYIAGSAYGSASTTFTNSYGHSVKLTGVKLTEGQEIVVRARARSTSYVMVVGNLIIEQTA